MNNDTEILIKNDKIYSLLISKLKNKNIPFKPLGGNVIQINKEYEDEFTKLVGEAFNTLMPTERTFSVPAIIQSNIEKTLTLNGYPYNIICFMGKEYIVLENKNYIKARALVDLAIKETIEDLQLSKTLKGQNVPFGEFKKCNEKS